jgi:hypothetical protein
VGSRSEDLHTVPTSRVAPVAGVGQRAHVEIDGGPDVDHRIEPAHGSQAWRGGGADVGFGIIVEARPLGQARVYHGRESARRWSRWSFPVSRLNTHLSLPRMRSVAGRDPSVRRPRWCRPRVRPARLPTSRVGRGCGSSVATWNSPLPARRPGSCDRAGTPSGGSVERTLRRSYGSSSRDGAAFE